MVDFLVSLGYSRKAAQKKAREVRKAYTARKRRKLTTKQMYVRASLCH